jgi:hypothetical protein
MLHANHSELGILKGFAVNTWPSSRMLACSFTSKVARSSSRLNKAKAKVALWTPFEA